MTLKCTLYDSFVTMSNPAQQGSSVWQESRESSNDILSG